MPQHNSYVIQTDGLSKEYDGTAALKSLNLNVPPNTIFGFLGPNGAGKTTTMKLLLGLARPTAGRGTIFGLDIVRDSLAIRSRIGYMSQQPRFYDQLTARETLRFTARLFFSGPQTAIEARINEMLALVGLERIADRKVKGFSGGERQRLGIAQAQINNPSLLILDEPAAALDPLGRRDVLAIMERLQEHTTVFYSTHILDDVQQVSDQVAILNRGELITQGSIEGLLNGDSQVVFNLTLKGQSQTATSQLAQQPWIEDIIVNRSNGLAQWAVRVNDQQAAEDRLLRLLLANEEVSVLSFNRRQYELEEVFVNLVEGGNDDRTI